MASNRALKKRIAELENQLNRQLSEEELNDIFEKYSFNYDNEPNIIIREKQVTRQKFVFDKLNEKGLDNTAIEKLLDMTIEDIECQHTVKSGIENKAGFILALWGILVATLFDSDNDLLNTIKDTILDFRYASFSFWITCSLAVAIVITGIKSLIFIYKTIKPHTYTKFMFEEKEENFKGAAINKNITYIALLDNVTNSWIQNRTVINNMADDYHSAIKWILAFSAILVLSFIILV